MKYHNVYVALGSNLEDPHTQLTNAIAAISQLADTQIEKISSFYLTQPVGFLDQPDFLNAVIKLSTAFSPQLLLAALQEIEWAQGRIRGPEKNGPRTLDLDLLLFDHLFCHDDHLIIPHPRMHEREFVLTPLREIAPELWTTHPYFMNLEEVSYVNATL